MSGRNFINKKAFALQRSARQIELPAIQNRNTSDLLKPGRDCEAPEIDWRGRLYVGVNLMGNAEREEPQPEDQFVSDKERANSDANLRSSNHFSKVFLAGTIFRVTKGFQLISSDRAAIQRRPHFSACS